MTPSMSWLQMTLSAIYYLIANVVIMTRGRNYWHVQIFSLPEDVQRNLKETINTGIIINDRHINVK